MVSNYADQWLVVADIDGLESRKVSGQLLCRYRHRELDAMTTEPRSDDTVSPLAVQSGHSSSSVLVFYNVSCISVHVGNFT